MGSSQLAQQTLLELPARRRIATFAGAHAWWGVDVSTRGVSIGWAMLVGESVHRGVRTCMWPKDSGGRLLATIYRETRLLAAQIASKSDEHRPGIVLVEQPSGAQPNPVLSYAVGVAQAAVYEGVTRTTDAVPHMETVTSSSWKKLACGSGAIRKPKRKADGEYGVLSWARLNGYPGANWDEADALAIAEAARLDFVLEQRHTITEEIRHA